MNYEQNKYRIPSARLANWDYGSNGFYFVTICTLNRFPYFGEIVDTQTIQEPAYLHKTQIGETAFRFWTEISNHFPFVELDEFIFMPDHMLLFNKPAYDEWNVNKAGPQSQNLGAVMRGYKAGVKSYATKNNIDFAWQSRYYDRVVKSTDELQRIRKYIADNPSKWQEEKGNPENLYR